MRFPLNNKEKKNLQKETQKTPLNHSGTLASNTNGSLKQQNQ